MSAKKRFEIIEDVRYKGPIPDFEAFVKAW